MKAIKKMIAIILAVCMLVGMPLSMDVSAIESGVSAITPLTKMELRQVMPCIADPRYADVDPTDNMAKRMFVVFNTISGNNGKAGSDILVVDSNGTLIKDQNNKEVVLTGYFAGGPMPAGWNKPLAWQLNAKQSFNGMTINNFFDVKALLESEYFAAKGAKLRFRCWETTVEAGDGKIADYYCSHDNSIKLTGPTVLTIGGVKRDGLLKDVVWSPVSFVKAQAIDERNIRLSFSESITQNNGLNNLFVAVRIVDTSNDYKLVYSGSSPLQYGLGRGWSYQGGELVAYLNKDLSEIFAICDKLNADNDTDKYKVMFCLEEIGSKLSSEHGEAIGNGYVDTLWGSVSKAPVSASHMPAANTWDGVYCEVTPASELKKNCMTITSANVSSREGLADRIIVTFSEPVSSVPVDAWVRIFDSTGALVRHDKNTMKVVTTETGHLQWKLSTWTKASADGKSWIAAMNAGQDSTNTIAGALDYAAKITDAAGKKVTPENGYKIQVAFLDQTAGGITKIDGNGLIDAFKSTNGKTLFAGNTQSYWEERGVCDIVESLSITDVSFYPESNHAIITFSEAIDMSKLSLVGAGKTTDVWLGIHDSVNNRNDPLSDDKGMVHTRLTNMRQFGNSPNKVVVDNAQYNAFKTRRDALIAAGTNCTIAIRMEGGSDSVTVPGFVSADGTKPLYRSHPESTWSGRHMVPTDVHGESPVVNGVVADCKNNALIVEFSEPIKYTGLGLDLKNGATVYKAIRTQVALQRFDLDPLGLDMDALYQVNAHSWSPVNANGEKTEDAYSQYWAFYFNEGVVETAYNYYAGGNDKYDANIGYGFGVFEASTSNMVDTSLALPLAQYMEDFETQPDASGEVRYLHVNSTLSGYRFFHAIDNKPGNLVTAEDVKVIDDQLIQITFSDSVIIDKNCYASIRVTENNNLVLKDDGKTDDDTYQLGGSMKAVNPDANGYSKVWNFTTGSSIAAWAKTKFYEGKHSDKDLCVSLQANNSTNNNGYAECVSAIDGRFLKASPWYRGCDGWYFSIKDNAVIKGTAAATIDGVAYESFDAALEAFATNGSNMTLTQNVEYTSEAYINIMPGQTLDLNGKTLTMSGAANSIMSTGAVIDSTEGGALIVIEQDRTQAMVSFAKNNPQLPLYDTENGGYRFYTASTINKGTQGSGDYVRFGMHLDVTDFALLKQEDNGGAVVTFELFSGELENGSTSKIFDASILKLYADNVGANTVLVLGVSGMNKLQDKASLTVQARIESAGVVKSVTIQ